jgi:arylsulfatase A
MSVNERNACEPSRRPNFIVILADDLGYGDVGCYGGKRIETPRLDALAEGGTRFTDFHASCPVCSPTRAGLLTGRYQQRAGIPGVISAAHHRDKGLDPSEITFARQLKAVGYATGVFGKWHLGYDPRFNPDKHGFDRFRGYVSGNVDYISHIDQTGVPDWWDNSTQITEEGYTTELITRHSVRFMEENRDRPFCLYVAHEAPHYPYQVPGDGPVRAVGQRGVVHGREGDVSAQYAEMIEVMDEGIGEIVDTVARLGLERDTFIFFFSDNGATPAGSNAPFRGGKGSLWEGGHRVPAIAYWPGRISAGQVTDEPTISLDLFPTLLPLAGASVPDEHLVDGRDLSPLLFDGQGLGERRLYWAYGAQRAVREGDWKLLVSPPGEEKGRMLLNLRDDPGEQRDLSDAEPSRVEALREALADWERDVGVDIPW